MILFDGVAAATQLEHDLQQRVIAVDSPIRIASVVFREDAGSLLYTRLKGEAAARVGIEYLPQEYSLTDESARVVAAIDRCNRDWQVTGTIVQKPSKRVWLAATGRSELEYRLWWQMIMGAVALEKDVDGLHPTTIELITNGGWRQAGRVLPATCQAVLKVIADIDDKLPEILKGKLVIIGRSDLVGLPLAAVLKERGCNVELIGSQELNDRIEHKKYLLDASLVVAATGKKHLLSGNMVSSGVALIDVGEPYPDIDTASVSSIAAYLSPVPGGVGPLTVACLMANAVQLAERQKVAA